MLAELTGAHLHVAHVSTAGAVERSARRERGVHVTAEVTPHHLTLTDEATLGYDTNTKVAPPLRAGRRRGLPGRRWSTAPSTRSPPTTRPTPCTRRTSSSSRRRPA